MYLRIYARWYYVFANLFANTAIGANKFANTVTVQINSQLHIYGYITGLSDILYGLFIAKRDALFARNPTRFAKPRGICDCLWEICC
jgi:hypothetical protein